MKLDRDKEDLFLKLVRNTGIILVFGCLTIMPFVVSHTLPVRAAEDGVSPSTMVMAIYYLPYFNVGIFAIAVLFAFFTSKSRRLFAVICFVQAIAVICFIGSNSSQVRDRAFVLAFAGRVKRDIGESKILKLRADFEKAWGLNKNLGSGQMYKLVPPEFSSMYRQTRINLNIASGVGGELDKIQVIWGGNFYRWGIEFDYGDVSRGGLSKVATEPLTTQVFCFVAQ